MKALDVPNALVVDVNNANLELSARNAADFKVLRPEGLNVYDILLYDYLVITQQSLEQIGKRLSA